MRRLSGLLLATAALLGACGDDDEDDGAATTTSAPADASSTTAETTVEETTTSTTLPPTGAEDPVAAAEAFMATFFPGNAATLSEFRQGDNRSGEIEVLRPSEGGGTANVASTLLLRLDDLDRWQVFGAVSPTVTIDEPPMGEVPAAPLTVAGVGRGFEATLVVRAVALDGTEVAQAVGAGGALADPEPYTVELDLSGVAFNTPLVVITSGGVGLEGDPGEFSAVRVLTA